MEGFWEKLARVARGIPGREIQEIPALKSPEVWEYAVQKHLAEKAGPHYDIRLNDGSRAFSFASRKELPGPGQKTLVNETYTHSPSYMGFEGVLRTGYGKGTVALQQRGEVLITGAAKDKVKFVTVNDKYPSEFVLLRLKDKQWLLNNVTATHVSRPDIPQKKESYSSLEEADLENYLDESHEWQKKIDGAHVIVDLQKYPRIFSYRPSKKTDVLIQHTFKIPELNFEIPDELRDSQARAELFAVDSEGKVVPVRTLSGILNSSTSNALETLKRKNYSLRLKLFDLIKYHGKNIEKKPYEERKALLQEVNQILPENVSVMPGAITPEEKLKLLESIKRGEDPETKEGIVVWPRKTSEVPKKLKFRKDFNIYIKGVLPGEGRLKNSAGALTYSLTEDGLTIGAVGSGWNDSERRDIWKNPEKYIGRVATVFAEDQHPRGL